MMNEYLEPLWKRRRHNLNIKFMYSQMRCDLICFSGLV